MKRKLRLFWKEWGITWEEFKMFIGAICLLVDLYLMYILMWILS